MSWVKSVFFALSLLMISGKGLLAQEEHSVARMWNELLLEAIREDFARPTVHARNLLHTSIAMYDAWAAYDSIATPFFLGQDWNGFECPFDGIQVPEGMTTLQAQEMAISYAAYRILRHRFQFSPGAFNSITRFRRTMMDLGYDFTFSDADYSDNNPAALGVYLADQIIQFGLQDGSNEFNEYENLYYETINPPLVMAVPGNSSLIAPNRWQSLTLDVFIDQSGNEIPFNTPEFLSPEWGKVVPFAMTENDLNIYQRDGQDWWVYHDPGPPPLLKLETTDSLSEAYKWGFALVSIWASHLDPADGTMWDISPAAIGNNPPFPERLTSLPDFYNYLEGGDQSRGHDINPVTGQPYPVQMVPRADYARVLAEFWADGPDSETPPGHWFTILNYVADHPLLKKNYMGQGDTLSSLEWDVKAYLSMGGAMHDAAISAWGVKGFYDYIRPVSAIRGLAERGQSSDPSLPNYNISGMPLVDGYIELVTENDPLAGTNGEHIGKVKLFTWRGPDYISDPDTDLAGVGWILAENWWPYQRPSFVTPPFAGYVSGHSTYSRAAAEVLTLFTGDAFFPGGVGEFVVTKDEFLVFEEGPSIDFTLQWATYRDASDQTSLSRIWGGIHPPADDIPGRVMGEKIGINAFNFAKELFNVDRDGDGYISDIDCDDLNAAVAPSAIEICDGIDNNCNGLVDELPTFQYFADQDLDGFGDGNFSIDTCLVFPPPGFVYNNQDCDDQDPNINPNQDESCDNVDNNCDGQIDEELPLYTYYLDVDRDGFGDVNQPIDTCISFSPVGYAINHLDCNDNDDMVNPNQTESCDGLDNNCDGVVDEDLPLFVYFLDQDGDGFGDPSDSILVCWDTPPSGYTANSEDCDDQNARIFPGATEIPDNLIDEDCSGGDLIESTLIFPNPTQQDVTILHPYEGEATIHLFLSSGQHLQSSKVTFKNSTVNLSLPSNGYGPIWMEVVDHTGKSLFKRLIMKY